MGNLKEKILKEEIKMYFVSENKLGIYGKTYEVRDELKNAGAIWNSEKKRLEIDEDKFKEMDNEIIEKVFELREKQRQSGIEHISQLLLSGELKAFLDKDDNYQLYGSVKNITRELNNVGFKFADKNYAIKRDDFDRIFSNEVKEVVNEYNKAHEKETKETSNEIKKDNSNIKASKQPKSNNSNQISENVNEKKNEPNKEVKTENKVIQKDETKQQQTSDTKKEENVKKEDYKRNNQLIEKMKNIIQKNETEDMKKYGYEIVVDSSIKEMTNQFTYTEDRVKQKITWKFGTIKIYAEDYYCNGQYIMTECYII